MLATSDGGQSTARRCKLVSKVLLHAATLLMAATVVFTVGSWLRALLIGKDCIGHGVCGAAVAALLGTMYGPLVCLVCVPVALSILGANKSYGSAWHTAVLVAGIVFLCIAGWFSLRLIV